MLLALLLAAPGQYRSAHRELDKLARQQSIEGDLLALVRNHSINLRCGPVGVPNHAPVPLLALYLEDEPGQHPQPRGGHIEWGTMSIPRASRVERDYVLDPHDPHRAQSVPPGFSEVRAEPLVADLPALLLNHQSSMDRAPLVENPSIRRLSPLTTPVRELPLRLPVIA